MFKERWSGSLFVSSVRWGCENCHVACWCVFKAIPIYCVFCRLFVGKTVTLEDLGELICKSIYLWTQIKINPPYTFTYLTKSNFKINQCVCVSMCVCYLVLFPESLAKPFLFFKLNIKNNNIFLHQEVERILIQSAQLVGVSANHS